MKETSPILITGIERSGSTILAKILAGNGMWFGDTTKMMENIPIKITGQSYVRSMGFDPAGQYPVPGDLPTFGGWSDWVQECMKQQGHNGNQPWAYKSYLITLMWRTWRDYYPEAKWVIVRRKPCDIVNSCMKTAYMKAFQQERGWYEWITWYEHLFTSMIQAGIDYKVIWLDRLLYGDYSKIMDLFDWLGLEWDNDLVYKTSKLLKQK